MLSYRWYNYNHNLFFYDNDIDIVPHCIKINYLIDNKYNK